MKLSEKGIETIFSALLKTIEERDLVFRQISQGVFKKHIEALEFEHDDFNGFITLTVNIPRGVFLTVEEAGILVRCAANEFCRLIMEHAPIDSAREVEALMYDLVKRIKKAEGKCSSE